MPGICAPSSGWQPTMRIAGFILEVARAAHDGAGGAHAGDEVRDATVVSRQISGPVPS
jgi:hypothetical protein